MKKVTTLLVALFVATLFVGKANNATAQDNVVKINPAGAIIGNLSLAYERVLNDKSTVQLGLSYLSKTYKTDFGFGLGSYETKYSGFGITPEYRYYLTNDSKDVPRGFYAGAFARYFTFKAETIWDDATITGSEVTYTTVGGGISLGHQWLFGDVFALDLGIGPWFRSVSSDVDSDGDDDTEPDFSFANDGVGFRFVFALGVAF